jgi:heavy metal translocating P-type ATPase
MGPRSENGMTSPVEAGLPGGRLPARIAGLALAAIAVHLLLRFAVGVTASFAGLAARDWPLAFALAVGGTPLVLDLAVKLRHRQFGSDLLAGISIVTAVILGELLAGMLVVLMLSGGAALETYAVRRASSVLAALAKRMPSTAHRKTDGKLDDISLDQVAVGDLMAVFPHEICPVDGTVVEGRGTMDESYLTGEPYLIDKAPGAQALSGAVNGNTALTVRADKPVADSRYARIMDVMRTSERTRPRMRRIGDQLGAVYTPVAIGLALAAWFVSGDPLRFLAVLVVATPCPLLIAIPVAIIGSISLAARRGIIIKDPAVLEKVATCRTAIFDKTGTLTYGEPELIEIVPADGRDSDEILALVAGLERYSRHPLASAVLRAAAEHGLAAGDATEVREPPGQGLTGVVSGRTVRVTGRPKLVAQNPSIASELPPAAPGLECVALIDGRYAATLQFRDRPRPGSRPFIRHLGSKHKFDRVLLLSGDRESEVRYLAALVGITEVHGGQSPEQKLARVRAETSRASTVFMGDGINDAPALTAATVGIAFGQNSDVTSEAAGAVILESSLEKVDEFLHVGARMRRVALQSAVGGMALSLIGMGVAAAGYLPPVSGAVLQELIDTAAVLNALRTALPPRALTDF